MVQTTELSSSKPRTQTFTDQYYSRNLSPEIRELTKEGWQEGPYKVKRGALKIRVYDFGV